jgi:hypothetical protein
VLIGVTHDETYGASCRFPLEDTTQQFHLIRLLPRRGDLALSRASSVEFTLYESQIDVDTCRHSVDDATDRFSVALAKRCQPENVSERIHLLTFFTLFLFFFLPF